MRETKDQKIARLEKKIEEQKKEMTKIKKDRKRLNYAVDKLKRQNKKLSSQSSKEDAKRMSELESRIEELKSAIETKDAEMAKEEERYQRLLSDYRKINTDVDAIRKEIWKDKNKFEEETMKRAIENIVKSMDGVYSQSRDDKRQLKYFNEGRRYWFYGNNDEDCSLPVQCCTMFSTNNLIIAIHPDKGRELSGIDKYAIQRYLFANYKTEKLYRKAMEELKEFKENNPNISEEELVEWTYHKGMELLPLYRDMIF